MKNNSCYKIRKNMKKIIILSVLLFTASASFSQSIEYKIREIARYEYPNDSEMQDYIYKQQISANKYMLTVTDSEVKQIVVREYPNDYSMQQYTYNNQLAAKNYMKSVTTRYKKLPG
jgi:hypothetical protein